MDDDDHSALSSLSTLYNSDTAKRDKKSTVSKDLIDEQKDLLKSTSTNEEQFGFSTSFTASSSWEFSDILSQEYSEPLTTSSLSSPLAMPSVVSDSGSISPSTGVKSNFAHDASGAFVLQDITKEDVLAAFNSPLSLNALFPPPIQIHISDRGMKSVLSSPSVYGKNQEEKLLHLWRPSVEQLRQDPSISKQSPRFPGDLYTPRFVRTEKKSRQAACLLCRPDITWHDLKRSNYW